MSRIDQSLKSCMDGPTEIFWCFDGQRQSTVWSCSDPREGIGPIAAQIPTLADR
jgi:hypothetical protein